MARKIELLIFALRTSDRSNPPHTGTIGSRLVATGTLALAGIYTAFVRNANESTQNPGISVDQPVYVEF